MLPFICLDWAADSSIVKHDIFEVIRTQNIQTYERYLCLKKKNACRLKNRIKS